MNRVIKFRAWDQDEIRFWTEDEMNEIGGYYYNFGISDSDGRFVLQQSTGLKDKNGKEIFEGDIFKMTNLSESDYNSEGNNFIVRFGQYKEIFQNSHGKEAIGFYTESKRYKQIVIISFYDAGNSFNRLIIGNIYENNR